MNIALTELQQQHVDLLRVDLAQAVIDLATVCPHPADTVSRHAKERAIEGLRQVRIALDQLGIQHSVLLDRGANG